MPNLIRRFLPTLLAFAISGAAALAVAATALADSGGGPFPR